ncbi:hypothetical protein OHA84_38055 (plasmid) [Streptomyces sp. NBC_00513]|uniref:hypothetical protein n=1 Tax=unclassified Streptomyces TaxID=2593676 RepID=UPI00225B337F|nr:hypothetical protein [Streptomyces sp. NBC_00424]MCX5078743.1 hypothetical protein [Streptomyces sp. NBC_00424]WUD46334.1 hypothetical protein OHA84_38055 [Streptomyces sp. NBC_00513]
MTRTTFLASTGCTRTSETHLYTHAVIVDTRDGEGRIALTWSKSEANVLKAARAAERAAWKNIAVEEVSVQEKPARTRKATHNQVPDAAQPAPAAERAPLALCSVRPASAGGFDVVNNSGLVVSGDWQTEVGARERANYLNACENRKRAEDALTEPQRRVYAIVRRDLTIRSGYRHNLTAVRSLHAAGLVKLTEHGPGSWTADYVTPPAESAAGDPSTVGAGVLPEDADHPVTLAARTALSGQPLADVAGPDDLGTLAGYWIRPIGDRGRLAVAWVEGGKLTVGADERPPLARLSVAKELFERTQGWLVEPGDNSSLVVWHVPTLEAAAQGLGAEQGRGAITDIWSITHDHLPDGRYFLRVEAPDHAAAIKAAEATTGGRQVRRAGFRLSARRLREGDLVRTVGERVRHVATRQTGTVEAVDAHIVGARSYRDGVTVAVDGRSRKTARALEWEPLSEVEDPEAAH